MPTTEKRFSKAKWLEAANAQKEIGFLTQEEIDDACEGWANEYDGKKPSEIGELNMEVLNEAWFV